jgi:N-ethylmaleimide reductase
VTQAVADRIGADRVGVRISPGGHFNDIHETTTVATYTALVEALVPIRPAYLHTMRRRSHDLHKEFRVIWPTAYMINTGYSVSSDLDVVGPIITEGDADLVSVGRLFISNPDLVSRWRDGADLAVWDEDTFYTYDEAGYTDYPMASPG